MFSDRVNSNQTKDFIINQKAKLVINDLSLNNIFYIGSKIDYKITLEFLRNITLSSRLCEIYYLKKRGYLETFNLIDENYGADFEDLLQYVSAKNSTCNTIITNDKKFPKFNIALKRTAKNIEDFVPLIE